LTSTGIIRILVYNKRENKMIVEKQFENLGFNKVNNQLWTKRADNRDEWNIFKDLLGTPIEWTLQREIPGQETVDVDFETYEEMIEFIKTIK